MKKISLLTFALLAFQLVIGQNTTSVDYFNWSNPETFKVSPSPIIKGYGYYSDSLSQVFNGKEFYVHNNEYYCIESWADYYYWFTQEYRHLFEDPQIYEYYYFAGDDYGMASYIASNKYQGDFYPSSITLSFKERTAETNRLASASYIPSNDKDMEVLNKELETKRDISSSSTKQNYTQEKGPDVFDKKRDKESRLQNNNYNKVAPELDEKSSSSKRSTEKSIR
ncbi:MAG: hypothetical protein KQH79_02855 [Bacteroidetes bacterium]|nr:hypothetical protein [Bacteroidota bacterium]